MKILASDLTVHICSISVCALCPIVTHFHSRPLLIMNRQQIITKGKNQPGDYFKWELFLCWMWCFIGRYIFVLELWSYVTCCFMTHYFCEFVWTEKLLNFPFQFSKQVPSESSNLRCSAGAVPKSDWDLWTGTIKLTSSLHHNVLSVTSEASRLVDF